MKKLIYVFFFIALTSCAKQELKLPKLQADSVDEVYNNSAVWIFYTVKNQDTIAELNQGNRIETTNWLFNIDRRLTLKQIYVPFKKLLEKRQKVSPHHIDGLLNYFSYADSISQKIKFLPFSLIEIAYKIPTLNDTSSLDISFYTKHFNFKNKLFLYNQLDSVINHNFDNTEVGPNLNCYYQENISFEKYVTIKAQWYQITNQKYRSATTDYYFK